MPSTSEGSDGSSRRELAAFFVILLAALVLRLGGLGERPLHHDESIHAYYSWRILTAGPADYQYDPVYHGPVLYYLTALFQWMAGPSDFSSRLFAVACGMGLVALAWPLRTFLGKRTALLYAVFAAFSPSLVYYSRSLRHDVPIAFFTLAAVVAFLHATRSGRRRLFHLSGLCIGLAAATKEDIYLTGVVFAVALVFAGLAGTDDDSPLARLTGWLVTMLAFVRRHVVVIGAGVLVALIVYVVFYTSLLTRPENWNATGRALAYWWGQQNAPRIAGPWWYYFPLQLIYEPVTFLAATAAVLWVAIAPLLRAAMRRIPRRPGSRWVAPGPLRISGTEAFLALWWIGAVVIYAWAQEKVPWLLVPVVVPQAIVAASVLSSQGRVTGALLAPLAVLSVWSMVSATFVHDAPRPGEPADATHHEPLVYVQTTYDVPGVVERITSALDSAGAGDPVVVAGEATWPLSWYLRGQPVHWGTLPERSRAPVLVLDVAEAKRLEDDLEAYASTPFEVRAWWQWELARVTLRGLVRFLVFRETWSPTGSTDAVLFVARDLGKTRQPVALRPAPTPRPYAEDPVSPVVRAVLGGSGSAPGRFDEPRGLAFDTDGTLVVADSKNHRIQRIDRNGTALAVVGGPDPSDEPGRFRDPGGVAIGGDGSIWVADTWNHRIQKLTRDGTPIVVVTDGFWGPRDLVVDGEGSVYVADTGNKRIVVYDAGGSRLRVLGSEGSDPGQFVEPVGLALDASGESLFVADTGNRRIQRIGLDGKFRGAWPAYGWEEFYTEPYLAWHDGLLWATDSFNHRVNAYGPDGNLRVSLGGEARGKGFARPIGVAAGPAGELALSDTMNDRVLLLEAPRDVPNSRGLE